MCGALVDRLHRLGIDLPGDRVPSTPAAILTGGTRFIVPPGSSCTVIAVQRWAAVRVAGRASTGRGGRVGALLARAATGSSSWRSAHPVEHRGALIAAVPIWVILLRRATGDRVPHDALSVLFGFWACAPAAPGRRRGHGKPTGFLLVLCASLCWSTGSFVSPSSRCRGTRCCRPACRWGGRCVGLVVGLSPGDGGRVHPSSSTDALIAFVYLSYRSLIAYTAYVVAAPARPDLEGRHVRVREPGDRDLPRRAVPRRDITVTMLVGATVIVGSVAAMVRSGDLPGMWAQRTSLDGRGRAGFISSPREVVREVPESRGHRRWAAARLHPAHVGVADAERERVGGRAARLLAWFDRAVPEGAPYWTHTLEGDDDMPAHIKSSLLGRR